jgi:hypothetical protein
MRRTLVIFFPDSMSWDEVTEWLADRTRRGLMASWVMFRAEHSDGYNCKFKAWIYL